MVGGNIKKRIPLRRYLLLAVCLVSFLCMTPLVRGQVAGLSTLSVLDMPSSTRGAALGMDFLALPQGAIDLSLDNPSLIADRQRGQAMVSYAGLSRGTNFGTMAYAHDFERLGHFVFGVHFCSFGSFEGYTEEEVSTGRFSAADYVLSIGWGRAIDSNFSIGVSFKPVYSHYENYSAFALVFDVAGRYVSNSRQFAASIMGRNIGAQIVAFDNTVEHIPFELAAGLSYKLRNAPFRFFLNLAELQKWDIRYDDSLSPTSETDPFTGETVSQSPAAAFFDKAGRHLQVGIELNVGEHFFARIGYNYRKAAEMRGADVLNMSGFAFGFGFSYRGFDFAYAHNNYHLWQAPNYISISTQIDRFFR